MSPQTMIRLYRICGYELCEADFEGCVSKKLDKSGAYRYNRN